MAEEHLYRSYALLVTIVALSVTALYWMGPIRFHRRLRARYLILVGSFKMALARWLRFLAKALRESGQPVPATHPRFWLGRILNWGLTVIVLHFWIGGRIAEEQGWHFWLICMALGIASVEFCEWIVHFSKTKLGR